MFPRQNVAVLEAYQAYQVLHHPATGPVAGQATTKTCGFSATVATRHTPSLGPQTVPNEVCPWRPFVHLLKRT